MDILFPVVHRFSDQSEGGRTPTPLPTKRSLLGPCAEPLAELSAPGSTRFSIRAADTKGQRSHASYLMHKMYAWRGYRHAPLPDDPNLLTLIAYEHEQAVATVTVGVDSPAGMSADELYRHEIDTLRSGGARLCEFTRLAVDRGEHSMNLVATMFHVAYLFARRKFGATDLLAEVNPRHVRFYQRMLGFEQIGSLRICPRVGAPAVLLRLRLSHAQSQINALGGHGELARQVRSLYPLAFSANEEKGIYHRIVEREEWVAAQ